MTQPEQAVGGEAAPAERTAEEYFHDLAAEEFGVTDEPEEPAEAIEGEEPEAVEEAEDVTDIEEEADDLPPIEAPVSWDAEAKEVFKSLPREAQEIVQKREAERERFVQQKSQEATRAKTDALQQASSELAQIERSYAQQYEQIAQSIVPERPNPALLATDPYAYAAQQQKYEDALAQRSQAQQVARQYAEQAQAREAQAEREYMAEQHRAIVENFPEYADPTTGPELQRKLSAVAKELGYPDELISQARAADILAMKVANGWREDAQKYRDLMKQKMAKVREAKGKPPVSARPGVSQQPDQLRSNRASAAFERARTSKNAQARGEAFFDYLKNAGHI